MDGEQQLGSPQRAFRKDLIAMHGVHNARHGFAVGHLYLEYACAAAPSMKREARHELS